MITIITGVPGGGKTLKTVELLDKELDAGRACFSNIDGFIDERCGISPDDWRDTPEGSFVVYDEAQKIFPSTAKVGVSEDPRIRALEMHRHTGHDIVLVTQDPALIHLNVRKLVGRHIHLHRSAGLKRATVYTWDFCVTSPNSRTEQKRADINNWFFPKKKFDRYQSATKHTHKFSLPFWPTVFLALGGLLGGVFIYSTFFRSESFAAIKQGIGAQAAPAAAPDARQRGQARPVSPNPGNEWTTAGTLPAVRGCAILTKSCRCWDGEGHQLDLNLGQCLTLANSPLPMDFSAYLSAESNSSGAGHRQDVQSSGVVVRSGSPLPPRALEGPSESEEDFEPGLE
ncbi:zonular occludens toxin domain-containing protein [Arenimonas oryziterrae]|uniref:Zona occludens toxin N-terminal domain-containing protein n=2 Tax=Arenimonas TaxID=490567 RepID=A0A091APN7_9GAMM|nr:zonular occludens toxin domain-containing protein [Arenimonas oryziterrae]KFN42138.1 hypothetical protein N789_14645 [Arenimonas oryziterrae DSM 21050 = YC6267]